jgi:hypothetical protein
VKSDYTPEKFLDQVPQTDIEGHVLDEMERISLADQLSKKRLAEKEAELTVN